MNTSLPIRPNPLVHRALVRAERMLSHAIGHSAGSNEIDRMIAIHGLDNACEFLLRIIGDHLDLESKTGKSFDFIDLSSLAGETSKILNELYGYRLPYLSDLKTLRQIRNLVQHGAIDPQGDIQRFVTIVRRFFNRVLQEVFGMENGEIATSSLIDDNEIKGHLVIAERAIAESDYLKAVIASRDAFENAYYRKLIRSNVTLSLLPAIVEAKASGERYPWSMVTIKNELELTRLGINTEDTRRFLDYVNYIPTEYRCDGWSSVLQRDWNADDANFCYQFSSSIALQWQLSEKAPINEHKWDSSKYRHTETLASIDLSETFEGGCSYFSEPNIRMSLWYLDKKRKDQLEKLAVGHKYHYENEFFENGISMRQVKSIYMLKGVFSELTTNNPERWKVIIWFDQLDPIFPIRPFKFD